MRADAEDIVQEVFAQVWAQAKRYDPSRGAVAAWMLTLARSRAIDRLRARRARPEAAGEPGVAERIPDAAATQDLELLSAEQVSRLQRALEGLPEAQREALELAYYGGFTQSELAERLGQPIGTIKSRMFTGLARLRELLTEPDQEPERWQTNRSTT